MKVEPKASVSGKRHEMVMDQGKFTKLSNWWHHKFEEIVVESLIGNESAYVRFSLTHPLGRAPHPCVTAKLLLWVESRTHMRLPLEKKCFYQMALLFHVSFKRLVSVTLVFLPEAGLHGHVS
ncbi:hypothetical protein AVEN_69539-1 [Araneus ventricosus]|uniref:Uncharacterized protein n=1 Tax=Araneus ventricosus TaxID=182803 RepID=A0A4Y2RR80_ARAVE|nr:hypothetical protein AVEN_69539-1 [Araneus ventricosus]